MTMPTAVESYKRYTSRKQFERDKQEMTDHGWKVEGIEVREPHQGGLARLVPGSGRTEIDAHYIRDEWDVELEGRASH